MTSKLIELMHTPSICERGATRVACLEFLLITLLLPLLLGRLLARLLRCPPHDVARSLLPCLQEGGALQPLLHLLLHLRLRRACRGAVGAGACLLQ